MEAEVYIPIEAHVSEYRSIGLCDVQVLFEIKVLDYVVVPATT